MEMGGCRKNSLYLKEFQDKCRICLKNHGDMTDALASGISDTVMEVINLKITWDDELPKCICQDCRSQIEIIHKFQSLAKDSDNYLRALLLAEKCFNKETGNDKLGISPGKNSRYQRTYARKKFKHHDKMYLIHVDKGGEDSESQSEVYIKDLNSENDNLELTDFCKSLMKTGSGEPSHPVEQLEKNLPSDPDGNSVAESLCDSVFSMNWFIYQCNQCRETFQSKDCLSEHLKVSHGNQVSMTSVSYTCRLCSKSMDDESLFLEHLKIHQTEGFSVLNVDGIGQRRSSQDDLKKELFPAPKIFDHSLIKNRVYKVNISCCRCFSCQKIEPAESINDHLKVCFPDFEVEENHFTPHLKFTCPACSTSWIDDCEEFKQHLLTHRENNVFFVKVNILGEPAELTEVDFMFTPFEKALGALQFGEGESGACPGSRIIKMRNLFSCQICDLETTSVNLFSEHYLEIHGSARPISCVCPVCRVDFKFWDLREISDFQRHMINHKGEGVCFLKVGPDGIVVNDHSDGSGLFSNVSELLLGRVQCPELECLSSTSVPVAYLERTDNREGGECSTKKKDVVTRLKDFTKKENKCARGYICEKCGKECPGKVSYRKHFLTHGKDVEASSQKRPKCSVCDKTFSTRAILTEHKRHHSENEAEAAEDSAQTICEICGRGLPNNASLAKHRKLHAKERENEVLKCRICGRSFRRESALNRHLSAHLNPNYFECGECKLPLPSMASLERHKLGHQSSANTHDCNVCKVSFLTKDRLTAHETHTGHNQNRKRFECNVCHERFFIGREFTKHIKLHPKYKMSECALCGKRLSTMQSLMLHLDRHFESNSILCPHCGKQCFEERNYRRHLLTHKGVKPFACDVEGCGKSFYTYFEVKRHKKYHNNTRDFNCPYCPKSFHEANHLKVHIRTHTGERPYTCPHCNKSFVTRTRCKQHISLVHQGVGYDLIRSTISKKVAVFEAVDTPA